MLFLVLLLSFIIGEFCLEFIVLYKEFADLDASWKISCQGDPTWGDVYPYSEGIFKPYWKTGDCRTLILPGRKTIEVVEGKPALFSGGWIYVCGGLDRACELIKAGSEGIKGAANFIFEGEVKIFVIDCESLFYFEVSDEIVSSYYNIPLIFSPVEQRCLYTVTDYVAEYSDVEYSDKYLTSSQLLPGSTITPEKGSSIKSIVISNSQDEPTEGDRYIFKVDFSGLSTPWFMVHMCAKKEARKECFSDKTVVLEKDSFGNFSLSIGKSSVDGDTYIQISVYRYNGRISQFLRSSDHVFFTHRFIKKAEKEFELTVFPYTSSTGFNVYFHMLNCPIDYTDCDKDGTRDVVVTIFGTSSENEAKGLLVQGVKPDVNFNCVVTSHTCRATVTALLHKSTMFNYTPQKGCLGMLPPRTSSHVFQCGGVFIQIKG